MELCVATTWDSLVFSNVFCRACMDGLVVNIPFSRYRSSQKIEFKERKRAQVT
jgi:hypothetical protein